MRGKKTVINIITSLILQITTVICGFIVPRLIITTFGSEVNGLISSIVQFLGYITLLEAGVGPIVKAELYKPIANKDNVKIANVLNASEKYFKKIAKIFIIYIIVLCILFPIIVEEQFDTLFTISLVIIIAISTFAEYFFGMTYKLFLEADQKAYVISTIQISTYIVNTIVIIGLILSGFNIQMVKLVGTVIYILRPVIQNIYVKKKYKIDFKDIDKDYNLKQKWDGLAQHIAAVVHNNTDITILTLFSTIKDVSVYSVYLLVLNGVKNIILAFTSGIDSAFGDMIAKEEKEQLQKNFKTYELFYFTIITIVFSATIILIVPFIEVYTKGITDANYIVPIFACLMCIAEFIWVIRQPYNQLVKAAGRFKETKMGAWIEAGSNIAISVILVINHGMIGVAVGTLCAMTIRTIEFMIYTSKNILKRSVWVSVKKCAVIMLQIILVVFISKLVPEMKAISYISWTIYSIQIVILSTIVVGTSNLIVYKEERKELVDLVRRIGKGAR